MSGEQVEQVGPERLDAAIFEQRRLSHMLRQRGAEIEVLHVDRERLAGRERAAVEREEALRRELRDLEEAERSLKAEVASSAAEAASHKERIESLIADRDRLAADLKQAHYEMRREQRRLQAAREEMATRLAEAKQAAAAELAEVSGTAAAELAERERIAAGERERGERRVEELRTRLSSLAGGRDRIAADLKHAEYEARRAERRLARVDREAGEARRRAHLQLDALRAELREGLASRDAELRREQAAAWAHATETARAVEERALELGRARREVELLLGLEKERELLLAGSEQTLAEVAERLRRVRASRSWRWGHGLARVWRAATFRRRSSKSALDSALDRLGVGGEETAEDERRR
jgi:hypothetical protein